MAIQFSMSEQEVRAAAETKEGRSTIHFALLKFWRANGGREQSLTNGEEIAEALHWAARRG